MNPLLEPTPPQIFQRNGKEKGGAFEAGPKLTVVQWTYTTLASLHDYRSQCGSIPLHAMAATPDYMNRLFERTPPPIFHRTRSEVVGL